ncbi:MAG TPA: phage tail assembly protein [Rhizomicrobium sp.]|jgi:hypothetical protein
MVTTVPLLNPIDAHGETITALQIRPPVGMQIRLCGCIYKIIQREDEDSVFDINRAAVGRYIVALADIPSSSVDLLSLADFDTAQDAILAFFNSGKQAKQTVRADRKVTLLNAIQVEGKPAIIELQFGELLGRHLRKAGDAYRRDEKPDGRTVIEIDATAIASYIEQLTGMPAAVVDQISAPDWEVAQAMVLSFFSTAAALRSTRPTQSTAITNLPATSAAV